MYPHYTRINLLQSNWVNYLPMYRYESNINIFLNNKKSFCNASFSTFGISSSSVTLRQWIRVFFQKTRNDVIDKLIERVGGVPSAELITLPILMVMAIGIVKLEMHLSANIMWSHDRWVTWLDGCGQLNLSHIFLKLVEIIFFAYHVITGSTSPVVWRGAFWGRHCHTMNNIGYSDNNRQNSITKTYMSCKLGETCVTNCGSFVLLKIMANVVTNWGTFVITNWGKCCYKLGQLLQIRTTVITK